MHSSSLALLPLVAAGALTACIPPSGTARPAPREARAPVQGQAQDQASGDEPTAAAPPRTRRFVQAGALADPALAPAQPGSDDPSCDALCRAYAAAVKDTMYPQPAGVSRQLAALVPGEPGLIWNEHGLVLMSTWTHLALFEGHAPGDQFSIAGDTWWTAAPSMQTFCRATGLRGAALGVRIAQRLGMPATSTNDGFVQVWIDPKHLFRPCPDPEVQDHECQVQIPMVPSFVRVAGEPPWACRGTQVAGDFVRVQDSHLQWMCSNWRSSYGSADPAQNFPWTALGYTYDWGQEDHRGPSEFVAPSGTMVVFASSAPTDDYCAPAP